MTLVVADPDLSVWIPALSPEDVDDRPIDVQTWAATMSEALWSGSADEPTPEGLERTRLMLSLAGDRAYPDGPWLDKWIRMDGPMAIPLPVVLEIYPFPAAEAGDLDLHDLVRAHDAATVEPAVVDQISTPLGAGLRGLAYSSAQDRDGEQMLVATLSYAWAIEADGYVVGVRLWAAADPDQIIAAADDIEALAETLERGE